MSRLYMHHCMHEKITCDLCSGWLLPDSLCSGMPGLSAALHSAGCCLWIPHWSEGPGSTEFDDPASLKSTRKQIKKLLKLTKIPADRINASNWPIIPASHSQLQPFVCAGSPRPLGCGHVSVWPPGRPFPSLFWWAPLCKTPVPARP